MRSRLVAASAVVLLGLAACGGSDDGGAIEEDPAAEEDAPTDAASDTTAASEEGDCAGTDLTYTNLTTGESVDVVSTGAFSLADGAAYSAYLADYELTDDDFGIAGAEVPEGSNLITLAVTVFNAEETPPPLEAGTEITYTEEFGELTFTVIQQQGAEVFGTAAGAAGTVTITSVGDTFCAEVDYADDEKELAGTIEAEVVRDL